MAPPTPPPPWTQLALASACALLPTSAGLLGLVLTDGRTLGALVIASEPAWWVAAGASALLAGRRYAHLGAAAIGGVVLQGALLRVPITPEAPRLPDGRVLGHAERCAPMVSPASGELTVLHWRYHPNLPPGALAASRADLWVITGLEDPQVAEALGRPLGAPVQHTARAGGLAVLVPGGRFRACGRGEREQLAMPVPPGADDAGVALLTYPELADGRVLPLVSFYLPSPRATQSAIRFGAWSEAAADWTASLAAATSSPAILVTGTSPTHGTSRSFLGRFSGAGLGAHAALATWPAQVGPLPTRPLYHADRAWTGPAWREAHTTTLRLAGDHLAYVTTLRAAPKSP